MLPGHEEGTVHGGDRGDTRVSRSFAIDIGISATWIKEQAPRLAIYSSSIALGILEYVNKLDQEIRVILSESFWVPEKGRADRQPCSSLLIASPIGRHRDPGGCQFAFTIIRIHNSVPKGPIGRYAAVIAPWRAYLHRGEY